MKPEGQPADSPISAPTCEPELEVQGSTGLRLIAGVDEAGRGAIAGPVVAAAVMLPLERSDLTTCLRGVNDSKQLTAEEREALFPIVVDQALAYGIGSAPAEEIDQLGIVPANALAMSRAIEQLLPAPQFLLIDGRMRLQNLALPQRSIIRGDSLSLSIAAASILAKVTRDRIMVGLGQLFPDYGFARHKGYCTPEHVAAVASFGPCAIHRQSFAPIRQPLL
jgi:ribonuclease HII